MPAGTISYNPTGVDASNNTLFNTIGNYLIDSRNRAAKARSDADNRLSELDELDDDDKDASDKSIARPVVPALPLGISTDRYDDVDYGSPPCSAPASPKDSPLVKTNPPTEFLFFPNSLPSKSSSELSIGT